MNEQQLLRAFSLLTRRINEIADEMEAGNFPLDNEELENLKANTLKFSERLLAFHPNDRVHQKMHEMLVQIYRPEGTIT